MLASRWSSVVDYSRLTTTQGKQKGNKGDIVRQKDQGYVDNVALVFQATTSPVSSANVLFTQQVGLSRLTLGGLHYGMSFTSWRHLKAGSGNLMGWTSSVCGVSGPGEGHSLYINIAV